MNQVFDSYIENSFGEYKQDIFKKRQFEVNYRKYFPFARDALVLDIGIGRGEMLSCMKDWGYSKYLGIDISADVVAFCKSLGLNCELINDTVSYLKKHENSFDFITLLDVLEHVKKNDTIDFLKAINKSLKDDGVLVIQVPNLQAPDSQLHRYNDITHEIGYIEHSLRQVLKASGFSKINFCGFEEFVCGGCKELLRKWLRYIYWEYVRFLRMINGNLNPLILNPVFYAFVRK